MRCTTCNGSKQTAPLGHISKTCSDCKGVGYVALKELSIDTDNKTISNDVIKPRVIKRRKRAS